MLLQCLKVQDIDGFVMSLPRTENSTKSAHQDYELKIPTLLFFFMNLRRIWLTSDIHKNKSYTVLARFVSALLWVLLFMLQVPDIFSAARS